MEFDNIFRDWKRCQAVQHSAGSCIIAPRKFIVQAGNSRASAMWIDGCRCAACWRVALTSRHAYDTSYFKPHVQTRATRDGCAARPRARCARKPPRRKVLKLCASAGTSREMVMRNYAAVAQVFYSAELKAVRTNKAVDFASITAETLAQYAAKRRNNYNKSR